MEKIIAYIKRLFKYLFHGIPQLVVSPRIVELQFSDLLKERNVLITGGSSGIGFAIAKAYVMAGANVVIMGRDRKKLEDACNNIVIETGEKKKIHYVVGDIKDIANIEVLLNSVESFLGENGIDLLINNAGILGNTSMECSEEEFDDVFDTNLKSVFFLTRKVCDRMISNNIQGNILNIASSSSLRPAANPYTLSKWGVRAFTLGMAKKMIKYGIVVNGIAPGPTATPMMKKNEKDNIALPNNPSKRYGTPEEIANMSVVLASDMGRLVVGDIIYMTGGSGVITFDDI